MIIPHLCFIICDMRVLYAHHTNVIPVDILWELESEYKILYSKQDDSADFRKEVVLCFKTLYATMVFDKFRFQDYDCMDRGILEEVSIEHYHKTKNDYSESAADELLQEIERITQNPTTHSSNQGGTQ